MRSQWHATEHQKAAPRAVKMLRLRARGKSWREIGEAFGVSAQRAQALAKKHENGV